jgi:hypothetical protein
MAYDAAAQVYRAWDHRWLTFELGIGSGLSLFSQRFETRGVAPARNSLVPFVSFGGSVEANLAEGFYAGVGIAAETHFMRVEGEIDDPTPLMAAFAVRTSLAAGKRF